ncbi:cysteine desulfurase [Jeotgalibaca sp. A127]|uniref:cysteine desulfurase n=1 Tax=Jeotgalibaca sp. A127 TaxID=3457324 RepID=UPI003FD6BAEA
MDVAKIRQDFPILFQEVNDEPFIYLDNAATTQKPKQVLSAIENYYLHDNANVHRGVHTLSERATRQFEASRETVRAFIKARSTKEVLFTRGTTTSLNWVARGFGDIIVEPGDEIYITPLEHHSNVVPWQQLAKRKQAKLLYLPLNEEGSVDLEAAKSVISAKGKILAVTHASNVMGTINPIKELAELIHAVDGYIVVDGAQSTPHMVIDVQTLDADFFAFSGHKMSGPTGIGVLYGKEALLEIMEPIEFGGEMIDFVYDDYSTWTELPWKFEAGTPNIAGAIGLKAAIDYLNAIGMDAIAEQEHKIISYLLPKLQEIEGITLFGPTDPNKRTGIITFNIDGVHPHDVSTGFDMEGIAIRAGHHCAQPLMRYLDVQSTARASFYYYNTLEEAEQFLVSLVKIKEFFTNGLI